MSNCGEGTSSVFSLSGCVPDLFLYFLIDSLFPRSIVHDVDRECIVRGLGCIENAGITDDVIRERLYVGYLPFPPDLVLLVEGGEPCAERSGRGGDERKEGVRESAFPYILAFE